MHARKNINVDICGLVDRHLLHVQCQWHWQNKPFHGSALQTQTCHKKPRESRQCSPRGMALGFRIYVIISLSVSLSARKYGSARVNIWYMHGCMYVCMYICMYICMYSCSFLELYNDDLVDLLDPNGRESKESLRLRDDPTGGAELVGAKEVKV